MGHADKIGISQNAIVASVSFALLHAGMEGLLLYFEAKACRTTFLHYLLICLNGRLGWIPFTDVLENPKAPELTKDDPLNFDAITFKKWGGSFDLDFDFGD